MGTQVQRMPERLRPRVRAEKAGVSNIPELVREALAVARNRMILSGLLNPEGQALPEDSPLWTEEEALRIADSLTPADRAMLDRVSGAGELGAVIAPIATAERLMGAHKRALSAGMHFDCEDSIRFRGTHGLHPEQGPAIRGFTLGLGDVRAHLPFDMENENDLLSLGDRIYLHAQENLGVSQLGITFPEYLALQEERLGAEPVDGPDYDGRVVATVLNEEVEGASVLLGHWDGGTRVQARPLSLNFLSRIEPRQTAFRPWVRFTDRNS